MRQWLLPALAIAMLTQFSGCTESAGPAGIPGGSRLVDENKNQLVFTATEPGTLYLHDQGANRVILEQPLTPGQQFALDSRAGKAMLDGKELAIKDLQPLAVYQLFFKPASKREYHPAYNP